MNTKNKALISILLIVIIAQCNLVMNIEAISSDNDNYILKPDLLGVGAAAKDWTLKEIITDIDITFSSFTGRVVLLDFFATYCQPCVFTNAELREVRNFYSASELVIISIAIDPVYDSENDLEIYASENDLNWYIVIDTLQISNYYQVVNIPSFFIIKQDQRIAFAHEGIVDAETFINVIDGLIESPPTTINPTGSEIPEFWQKNWYWFLIGGVFVIIFAVLIFQRQRVIRHNRKVREERMEKRMKRERQRRK